MTYNKEQILKMLSNAPLYEGMEFHEGKNTEFLNTMDKDFYNYYDYAHGATKLAIIPIDKEKDYVIKIPYTGCYNHESGYYSQSIYHQGYEDYWEYGCAEDNNRPWDYCACEVNRYFIAEEEGYSKYFAKTELIGYINNYPIYVQEKCITLNEMYSKDKSHKHTKEERQTTTEYCGNYYGINADWLTDFRLCYGTEELIGFINFIQELGWDDDLRSENIGYIKNRPVLIDYSGFLD